MGIRGRRGRGFLRGRRPTRRGCRSRRERRLRDREGRRVLRSVLGPEEGLEPEAEHVEGGHAGGDEADEPEELADWVGGDEGLVEDLVLGEEAGPRRDAGDGEDAHRHGPEGDGDALAEAAHLAHVLFSTESVDDGARGEEEERLEEGVGQQMEDAGGVGSDSAGEEHVAELRDGGVGEDALDVVLHHADAGGEDCGGGADDGDDAESVGAAVEERVAARDHVDAGGDHRRRVNERGDRRGAFHRVGEPDVEGNLRGLAGGSEDEQKSDGGEDPAVPLGVDADRVEDVREVERTEVADDEEHREQETEVADAVDDEGLFAGVGGGVLLEVEADQQVRGETDALPADEQQQEAFGEDQHQHEEHEEVEVGEEAPVALFVRHVADRVDVDEEADAGDDAEHDEREVVDGEGEVDGEAGDGDPGLADDLNGLRRARSLHDDPEPTDDRGRNGGADECDGGDQRARQLAADGSIDEEAGEGKQRNQPEIVVVCGDRRHRGHDFIRSTESTFSVSRVRKMAMMMARPTAASAAATTMTKKTKIWPDTWCHMCAKATKVRLTALSISSIDMKMVMRLRLMRKAATPMEKSTAARIR